MNLHANTHIAPQPGAMYVDYVSINLREGGYHLHVRGKDREATIVLTPEELMKLALDVMLRLNGDAK